MPGSSLPSLCDLCCAARSRRWLWKLCASSKALRHARRLCCSGMCRARRMALCNGQLQPSVFVVEEGAYVMFVVRRRGPNASIGVAVAMPCATTRMSPQLRPRPRPHPGSRSPCFLESPRSAAVTAPPRSRSQVLMQMQRRRPVPPASKRFARTARRKDNRHKRSRTNACRRPRCSAAGGRQHRRASKRESRISGEQERLGR